MRGVIDRRILVNYRVDPAALDDALPTRFEPQTVDGYGIGGICLIRLRDLRPRGLPAAVGVRSENAAHRIAVETPRDAAVDDGVYIPRRDTDSRLNRLLGGRAFPGVHHAATFDVEETGLDGRDVAEPDGGDVAELDAARYEVAMESADGETRVAVAGEPTDSLPPDSAFDSVEHASEFFRRGSTGYSPNARTGEYEGLELHSFDWEVTPLSVDDAVSSYFEAFPDDAVDFDHALLMRDVDHEWRTGDSLCSTPESA